MTNYLQKILIALAEANVKFVVAGGVATVLHGVERLTYDLDVAVSMQKKNLERFIGVMNQQKLKPRVPVPATDLANPKHVEKIIKEKGAVVFSFIDFDKPLRHVDMFLKDDHSYEALKVDASPVLIQGKTVWIASKKKLIELKSKINPPRAKDMIDIEELTKLENETS